MSSDEKVLDFPRVQVTPEESARRVMVEATRLAGLAPGEWRLWIDRSAERLRIPRATLQDLIVAIIKNSEKMARDGGRRSQPSFAVVPLLSRLTPRSLPKLKIFIASQW